MAEVREWRRRMGGTLFGLWPGAASALTCLRRRLPLMPAYLDRAREIADAVRDLPGVTVVPDPPQTPMLHLLLRTGPEDVHGGGVRKLAEDGLWTWESADADRRPRARAGGTGGRRRDDGPLPRRDPGGDRRCWHRVSRATLASGHELRRRRGPRPVPRAEGGVRALRRPGRHAGARGGRPRGRRHADRPDRQPRAASPPPSARPTTSSSGPGPRSPTCSARTPRGVVFGRSATQLTFDLARTLAADWGPGDEVVVTRLDHDANVRPWVIAAEAAGATVRWVEFDPATGELTADDVAAVLSDRTRLVAVTGASNLIGTRPPVAAIADLVHAAGALLDVDGVHLTAHAPVDVRGARRRLLHLLAVQVPRPALRSAGGRTGAAGDAGAGQAAAVDGRGARAVRAGHAALRAAWPAPRRRSTSWPASADGDRHAARAAAGLDGRRRGVRGRAAGRPRGGAGRAARRDAVVPGRAPDAHPAAHVRRARGATTRTGSSPSAA